MPHLGLIGVRIARKGKFNLEAAGLRKRVRLATIRPWASTSAKWRTGVGNAPWTIKTYAAFSNEQQAFAFEKYLKSPSGRAFAKKRL
jgi:hypothetical protein